MNSIQSNQIEDAFLAGTITEYSEYVGFVTVRYPDNTLATYSTSDWKF